VFNNLRQMILNKAVLQSSVKRIIILDSVESTNLYAKSLRDSIDSTFIIASNQTKGRGRENREWKSFSDKNITISIILDYPKDKKYLGLLSILTANSVAQTLEAFSLNANVKWPNDVLVNSKKISGILLEAIFKNKKSKSVIVGVGINVNCTKDDFTKDNFKYRRNPTSILMEKGEIVSREDVVVSFLEFFYYWISEFKAKNYKAITDYWKARWSDVGQRASFSFGGIEAKGKILDINQNGELLLQVSDRVETISSGEIIV